MKTMIKHFRGIEFVNVHEKTKYKGNSIFDVRSVIEMFPGLMMTKFTLAYDSLGLNELNDRRKMLKYFRRCIRQYSSISRAKTL